MSTKSNPKKSNTPPQEFSELVANLLVSCFRGLKQSLSKDNELTKKLENLEGVVRKGVRISPASGLGKEIEEYFDRQKTEQNFQEEEKEIVKTMVLEVAETIRSMLSSSSGLETNISACVKNIEKAKSIQDILKLKDTFVGEMQKVRDHSQSLNDELEEHRKASTVLAEKLEQSQAQALVDSLTNVLNRAAYNMKIVQLIHEFKRYKEEWALLVLDIDHFKKFNDDYGHRIGDRVLKSVAGTVRNTIRISDQIFRYGGEEFVVVLNRVDVSFATQLAVKICRQVEKDYFVDGDNKLKVTISIGGTIITEDDTELSLFQRADKAMYQAKENGRNQVVMDA
ncbi:MAG: GGDEF domain-containing protein [Nitrospina sp.]|nr:GGDEF domain-containing protein [Nitrospina sp.]MBT3877261.1 GGDEF domain-containing protein [Nitrospina sp.]MBT4046868.1 GGDEF domain-containing protein [Nitrospina sp.]MBT4557410.1 GGDEF domain-containing protein [Nitrospina sp.]MBT5349513.1 GGDEF domain-containing protein [Nitrospina sp.]